MRNPLKSCEQQCLGQPLSCAARVNHQKPGWQASCMKHLPTEAMRRPPRLHGRFSRKFPRREIQLIMWYFQEKSGRPSRGWDGLKMAQWSCILKCFFYSKPWASRMVWAHQNTWGSGVGRNPWSAEPYLCGGAMKVVGRTIWQIEWWWPTIIITITEIRRLKKAWPLLRAFIFKLSLSISLCSIFFPINLQFLFAGFGLGAPQVYKEVLVGPRKTCIAQN